MPKQPETLIELARSVHSILATKGPTSRSDLNALFRATSDFKRTQSLTLALKSLLAFGHVKRSRVVGSSTIYFWVSGAQSPYEENTDPILDAPASDYFNGVEVEEQPAKKVVETRVHIAPGPQLKPNLEREPLKGITSWPPTVVDKSNDDAVEPEEETPTEPEVEADPFPRAAEPQPINDVRIEALARAYELSDKTSLDTTIVSLCDLLGSATISDIMYATKRSYDLRVVSMRAALCARFGKVKRYRRRKGDGYEELFVSLNYDAPEGFVLVGFEPRKAKQRPVKEDEPMVTQQPKAEQPVEVDRVYKTEYVHDMYRCHVDTQMGLRLFDKKTNECVCVLDRPKLLEVVKTLRCFDLAFLIGKLAEQD